jgi:hypothetical protein
MALLVAGLIVGVMLGLVIRPVLDAYIHHRMLVDADEHPPAHRPERLGSR